MTELNHSEIIKLEPTGLIDRFAKVQLQKKLNSLPRGCLCIDDDGDIATYGSKVRQPDVQATMIIHQQSAYRDIVFGGSTGAAEAYMLGKWTSPNLVDLVRLMAVNIDFLNE
ncbi:MAG: cyclopropane-fatty-acyl-phospholipid synthase, partial [Gammaproteobacteria bacterium]